MPEPRNGETKEEFISRFMQSAEAIRDYPDEKVRAAVAYSLWERHQKGLKLLNYHRTSHTCSCIKSMVDVHPNCQCQIIDGEWITQSGVCDYCLRAAEEWNSSITAAAEDILLQKFSKGVAMKLNQAAYDCAMNCLTTSSVSQDDYPGTTSDQVEYHLGMDGEEYHYACMAGASSTPMLYPKALKKIAEEATTNGHPEIAEAAKTLLSKEMPKLAPKKKSMIATVIKDKKILLSITKSIKKAVSEDGYWALATVQDYDRDGDLVMVDGIQHDLDVEHEKYLPLLPAHQRSLANGSAPEIGRIDAMMPLEIDGKKALAFHFEFALDEQGEPIDDLVRSYYKRYKLGFSNSFSVGMEVLEAENKQNDHGGYTFTKTHLYEVSAVAIPANAGAVGLTRSLETDTLVAEIRDSLIKALKDTIQTEVKKGLECLNTRLDMIEADYVAMQVTPPTPQETTLSSQEAAQLLNGIGKKLDRF